MNTRRTRLGALWLAIAGLGGCFGSWGRPERPLADAAWVGDASALPGLDLGALHTGGLKELFLETGTLEWTGATPRVQVGAIPAVPNLMRTSLVITGAWSASLGDSKGAGARLAEEVKRLVLAAQARGVFPSGVHLDLQATGNLTSYAQGLRTVRGELPKTLLLSASVQRGWLSDEAAAKVARAVDFSVLFVYGQRPGEPDQTDAWDFQEVVKAVRKMEALKRPYLAGVVTVGSATHQGARGEPLEWTTAMGLSTPVENPRLKVEGGFTLEGLDRSVYAFRAEAPTNVGSWPVARGEGVRLVGTSPSYLQQLRKRIAEVATPRYRGMLFYRLPLPAERLTPSAAQLLDALGPTPPSPDLVVAAELLERTPQHWVFKVVLENRNDEHSDMAVLANNFVEVAADGGLIGTVNAGAFHRFELLRKGSDAVDIEALRTPQRARLYLPVLEGKGRYESGPVELRIQDPRTAQVTLSASFLLPDGRVVAAPGVLWTPTGK